MRRTLRRARALSMCVVVKPVPEPDSADTPDADTARSAGLTAVPALSACGDRSEFSARKLLPCVDSSDNAVIACVPAMGITLRTYTFLDALQPQLATFM